MPTAYANFFVASTGAAAALVGLLFVAISIAPERTVARGAPAERQAVAASSFAALVNAFFISIAALIPDLNLGSVILLMSSLALAHALSMGWTLAHGSHRALALFRRMLLAFAGVVIYGFELSMGLQLVRSPAVSGVLYPVPIILLCVYGIALVRAWELLGAHRQGLLGWLSALRNEENEEGDSTVAAASHQATPSKPTADKVA